MLQLVAIQCVGQMVRMLVLMSQIEHYLSDGVNGVIDAEYIMALAQNAETVLIYGVCVKEFACFSNFVVIQFIPERKQKGRTRRRRQQYSICISNDSSSSCSHPSKVHRALKP